MAKFIVDLFTSLDGYGSGPVGYWGKEGPELVAERARAFGNPEETLVFGANTYKLMQIHAPEEGDPSGAPLNDSQKIVISESMTEQPTWKNTTLISENALTAVPRLKEESPRDLRCHGSIAMNRSLLTAGLVDQLEIMVFAAITGETGSDPILADLPDIDVDLVDSKLFDGRTQQLIYEVKN